MRVTRVENESCRKIKLIGRKYTNGTHWGEWWEKNLFASLESTEGLAALNDNGYIGLMRNGKDGFEYWIGMFFESGAIVPEGFEALDIPDANFAVFHIYGNEQKGEIYGEAPTNTCIDILKKSGLDISADFLRFERYNCPRYTTPDELGNVILDYGFAIK